MDMSRHNADLAFTGSYNTGTVRADETRVLRIHKSFYFYHIQNRYPLCDAYNQFNSRVHRLHNRICCKCSRHINDRCIGLGLSHRLINGVKNRNAINFCTAFARRYTTHHLCAVGNHLLCMKSSLLTGNSLADNSRVFINKDAHKTSILPLSVSVIRDRKRFLYLRTRFTVTNHGFFAAFTTFSAASLIFSAVIMFSPDSAKVFLPKSIFVPCNLTTSGTFTPTSLAAAITPSAIISHLIIPPKIFIKTALTFSSDIRILNAAITCSLLAPPPTSRKLAGMP